MITHANPPRRTRSRERGVTLVELMIAITIGLLITVVVAQLFLGSRQTFATTDDVSRMQDNIRFAQQLLARTVHLAGYKSQANSITTNIFSGANAVLTLTDGGNAASDAITLRFQGSGTQTPVGCNTTVPATCTGADGYIVDCLGNRIDAGVMATNLFNIQVGANGRNALFCNNVEVVPNVANMQILYGEDTNGHLVADTYISPPGNANNVVSVRIALLFETPTATSKATVEAGESYNVWGNGALILSATSNPPAFQEDRRIRRLVSTTINLRNRTP